MGEKKPVAEKKTVPEKKPVAEKKPVPEKKPVLEKKTEAPEPLKLVATEGEAVIKDVVRGEAAPAGEEKVMVKEKVGKEEGIHDISVDEMEVEDDLLEPAVNGDVKDEKLDEKEDIELKLNGQLDSTAACEEQILEKISDVESDSKKHMNGKDEVEQAKES